MSSEVYPTHAFCEWLSSVEVQTNGTIQHFLAGLSPDQQRRFHEFAEHFIALGFEAGLPREPNTEAYQAAKVIEEATILLKGAGTLRKIIASE